MAQPAVPDSADWQRRWTIDAEAVTLQPVTRRIAHDVLDGGPVTRRFEPGSLHDRIPQAMGARVGRLAAVPGVRRITAVTGAQNTASRRLLERQGFHITDPPPGTDEVRYTLSLS